MTTGNFLIEIIGRKVESGRHFPLKSDQQPSQNSLLYFRQNACSGIGKTMIENSRSSLSIIENSRLFFSKSRERFGEPPGEIDSLSKLTKQKPVGYRRNERR
jgi:hypothetical protein